MPLTVKISATLRNYVPDYNPLNGLSLDIEPGTKVGQILQQLSIPSEKVKVIMINGISATVDHELNDGDRLGLFPPVGGG